MKQGNRIGLAAVLVCVFTPGLFANTITVFDFNSLSDITGTPFTDTVAGLEASFSSDGDPLGFVLEDSAGMLKTLTGTVLVGTFDSTLTIDFSAPQTSISTNFATDTLTGPPSVPLNLTAFNGASEVGGTSATGVIPPGFELPEGVISFSGPAFDSVVLSSPALSFVIDNVTVSTVPTTPEPSSLSLVALAGLVGFCVSAIKRLRRRGA